MNSKNVNLKFLFIIQNIFIFLLLISLLYLAELQAHKKKHREKQERLYRLNDTKQLIKTYSFVLYNFNHTIGGFS